MANEMLSHMKKSKKASQAGYKKNIAKPSMNAGAPMKGSMGKKKKAKGGY